MRKNNIMKKWDKKHWLIAGAVLIILLIAAVSLFFVLREEKPAEPPLDEVLKEKLTAYETDLLDSLGSMETNDDVSAYLLSWAKNKQIDAEKDAAGNVIYTIKPAKHAKDAQPAAVFCSFDSSDMESHIEEIAVALTISKNVQNNSPLQVIFLADEEGNNTGIRDFDINMLKKDSAVFCLSSTASARVSTVTGGFEHISISKKLSRVKPTYNKAYKITLKNCPEELITGKYDSTLNPIKTLGGVLANFKSTSLLFELSSFYGGTNENYSPSKASMTVVINDSDSNKLTRKLDNSIEKIYEKYGKDYPDIEYTYEEVDLPSKVIAKDDTDNLVSLMYTTFNGVYNRDDEGTITALSNIGKISTKNSRLKIDVAVMCSNEDMMQDITDEYETICGLCDVKCKISESYPIYNGNELEATTALLDSFEEAFGEFTDGKSLVKEDTAILTDCTFIHEKNDELPIIFCGITTKAKHKITGSIVTWLDQGEAEEK